MERPCELMFPNRFHDLFLYIHYLIGYTTWSMGWWGERRLHYTINWVNYGLFPRWRFNCTSHLRGRVHLHTSSIRLLHSYIPSVDGRWCVMEGMMGWMTTALHDCERYGAVTQRSQWLHTPAVATPSLTTTRKLIGGRGSHDHATCHHLSQSLLRSFLFTFSVVCP